MEMFAQLQTVNLKVQSRLGISKFTQSYGARSSDA